MCAACASSRMPTVWRGTDMSWRQWAEQLRQSPATAVAALLRGSADISPFDRVEAHEFLLAVLPRSSRLVNQTLLGEPTSRGRRRRVCRFARPAGRRPERMAATAAPGRAALGAPLERLRRASVRGAAMAAVFSAARHPGGLAPHGRRLAGLVRLAHRLGLSRPGIRLLASAGRAANRRQPAIFLAQLRAGRRSQPARCAI